MSRFGCFSHEEYIQQVKFMNMTAEYFLRQLANSADSSSDSNKICLFVAGSVPFLSSLSCPGLPTTLKAARVSTSETCCWIITFFLTSCFDMSSVPWVSFVGTIASSPLLRVVRKYGGERGPERVPRCSNTNKTHYDDYSSGQNAKSVGD